MTKAQANDIKSMITDPFMQTETQFLNKLKARNCSNFVITSDNDIVLLMKVLDISFYISTSRSIQVLQIKRFNTV